MNNYTTVFGGTTVFSNPLSFAQYTINSAAANFILQFALDNFPGNVNVMTTVMEVNATVGGATLQLPPANLGTLGNATLIVNTGANAFSVVDGTGVVVVSSVAPGSVWQFYLRQNAAVGGANYWGAFQFGAQISTPTAGGLAGSGLLAIAATLNQIITTSSINTNFTFTVANRANAYVSTGGAITWTLPSAAGVGNGFYLQLRNQGTSALTVNAANNTDLINNISGTPAFVQLQQKDSCFIVSDGTNWWTIGLTNLANVGFTFQAVSLAGQSGTYTLPPSQQGFTALRFTGALAGNTSVVVPNTVAQYWIDNETTGGFTLQIGTAGQVTPIPLTAATKYILYCDASNVINAVSIASGVVPIATGGTGATTANQALINLGGTSIGIQLFTVASAAAAQAVIGVDQILNPMIWA